VGSGTCQQVHSQIAHACAETLCDRLLARSLLPAFLLSWLRFCRRRGHCLARLMLPILIQFLYLMSDLHIYMLKHVQLMCIVLPVPAAMSHHGHGHHSGQENMPPSCCS
jgi:hypothetical protein